MLPEEIDDVDAVERMLDLLLFAGRSPSRFPAYNSSYNMEYLMRRRVRVVQFGANTGTSGNDPVYGRLNYTEGVLEVVMVEPVPHLFRNLSDTYANAPNVKPMWGAVCPPDSGATATFYAFKQNATSYEYYNTRLGERQLYSDSVFQIGSFIKRFLWHNSGSSEEEIEEVIDVLDVPCLTLPKIMCNMGWGHVDYLHIDAEGFDDKVVLSSAVEITRPFIIRLEAQHIEGADMITYLESVGYKVLKVRAHGVLELMAVWANLKSLPPSKGLQCKALRSTLS